MAQVKTSVRKSILVIDDERDITDLVRDTLVLAGYSVVSAHTAHAGLEALGQHKDSIGLILLDIALPGESGIELLDKIKIMPMDIPVVLLSGYISDRAEAISLGAAGVLIKPFTLDALEKLVHSTFSE